MKDMFQPFLVYIKRNWLFFSSSFFDDLIEKGNVMVPNNLSRPSKILYVIPAKIPATHGPNQYTNPC